MDLYRRIFDLLPDPALVVDSAGVIVEVNGAARRFFDLPEDACAGKPIHALLGLPSDWLAKAKYTKESWQSLMPLLTGRSARRVDVTVSPLGTGTARGGEWLFVL
ncbi:MAG: fold [Candidatus Hydrogenedentota bacterium]